MTEKTKIIAGMEIQEDVLKLRIENEQLEQENNKLLDVINNQDVKLADLEKQIEKMKCCENCKYNSYWGNELHCNYGLKEALQEDKLVECNKMDKWEIK